MRCCLRLADSAGSMRRLVQCGAWMLSMQREMQKVHISLLCNMVLRVHRWSAVHMQQLHVQAYELYLRTNIDPVFYVGPYTKILMSCAYLFMHTALSLGIQILEDKSGLVSQK